MRKGELAYVNDQVFQDMRFNIFSIKSFISYGIIEINKNICVHIIYIERERCWRIMARIKCLSRSTHGENRFMVKREWHSISILPMPAKTNVHWEINQERIEMEQGNMSRQSALTFLWSGWHYKPKGRDVQWADLAWNQAVKLITSLDQPNLHKINFTGLRNGYGSGPRNGFGE